MTVIRSNSFVSKITLNMRADTKFLNFEANASNFLSFVDKTLV